jgi:hypothetical protein
MCQASVSNDYHAEGHTARRPHQTASFVDGTVLPGTLTVASTTTRGARGYAGANLSRALVHPITHQPVKTQRRQDQGDNRKDSDSRH